MNKETTFKLLQILYRDTIEMESAINTYQKFLDICADEDTQTMDYLIGVVNMSQSQRLKLRNSIAERGFELTPNELNQYIFLLLMAISRHIDG